MAEWVWHRVRNGREEFAVTEGMTPPKGKGWTLHPGQVPAGRVADGTGPTKRHSSKPPKTRRGEYDSNGVGKVTTEAMKDDGRPLRNTLKQHGTKPGASAAQRRRRTP